MYTMIHAYHVIIGAYGCWLPNDPRGSRSEFVGKWELVRFGRTTKSAESRELNELTPSELRRRDEARRSLKYPAVQFNGRQARAIARGFANACRRNRYTIWACAILPEHTHLVVARHTYEAEKIVNLLKGAATRQLIKEGIHPLAEYQVPHRGRPPRMWAEDQWIGYLDSEYGIDDAIAYVVGNPEKEGRPKQDWSFVTPFAGLPKGWLTYR